MGGGLRALGDGGPARQGRGDTGALGQRKVFTLEDTLVHSEPSVCACVCVRVCVRACVCVCAWASLLKVIMIFYKPFPAQNTLTFFF